MRPRREAGDINELHQSVGEAWARIAAEDARDNLVTIAYLAAKKAKFAPSQ